MKLFTRFEDYHPDSSRPLVLALGNFDGFHLGHQQLIHQVLDRSKRHHGMSAVLTFPTHPQAVLHPGETSKRLFTLEHKLFVLEQSGIQTCFLIPFDGTLASMEAEDFVVQILLKQLQVKTICLGYNARFGRARKGNGLLMKKLSEEHGFEFVEQSAVDWEGEPISSSRVRQLILSGQLQQAAHCLGRGHRVVGKVIHGDGLGTSFGFPTANLELPSHLVMPPEGVYAVRVREMTTDSQNGSRFKESSNWYSGAFNYGRRPSVVEGASVPQAEVCLLDYSGKSLYGSFLELEFSKKIREEKKFDNLTDLSAQIQRDVIQVREHFNSPK